MCGKLPRESIAAVLSATLPTPAKPWLARRTTYNTHKAPPLSQGHTLANKERTIDLPRIDTESLGHTKHMQRHSNNRRLSLKQQQAIPSSVSSDF